MVRPDGSIDLHGYRGNISTDGWRLVTEQDGSPRFVRGAAGPDDNWDSRFSRSIPGSDRAIFRLALDGNGILYAGGLFTTIGGVSANRIARWNGTSWSALGTGVDNTVWALLVDGAGNLYVGGDFQHAGGLTVNGIAKWDGTNWSGLGSGTNFGTVYSLVLDSAGNLYAGGHYQFMGGVSAANIARWNGTSWSTLGPGRPFGVTSPRSMEWTLCAGTGNSGSVITASRFTMEWIELVATGWDPSQGCNSRDFVE